MNSLTTAISFARKDAAALNRARVTGGVELAKSVLCTSSAQARRWLANQGNAHVPAFKIRQEDGRIMIYTLWIERGDTHYAAFKFLSGSNPLPLP